MDITVEIKPDCTASLTAVVPAIDATACRAILVARYASRASIPGFRQGKAPLALVEKRYAKEIGEELSDALFEDVSTEALKQNPNLKVLDFGESNETWGEDGSYHVSSS
ncbi:MAG: trigger factor family protein, partial [Akkermansia sp.]